MKSFLKANAPAFFIGFVMTVVGLMRTLPSLLRGELPGNDDYMRLAVVRDWLDGQAFQDLTQYRLYPEEPLQSHWARLPDILLAAIIKPLTPLIGQANAELVAVILLPTILLFILLMLTVAIARRMSDAEWMPLCAAIMAGLCFPLVAQVSPGRIDHHGLQIVLAMGALLCLLKSKNQPRWAIMAGLLGGLGLWVGIESLPWIGGLCAAISISWAFGGYEDNNRLRYFGLSLFGSSALCLAVSSPPSTWFAAQCDALSSVYIILTGGIALAMIGASFAGKHLNRSLYRLNTIAGLGGLAAIITLIVFPQCLQGPYSELDPRLEAIWLENVAEAKPVFGFLKDDPVTGVALLIVPLLAAIALFFNPLKSSARDILTTNETTRSLWICLAFCFLAGCLQLRLMTFAGSFAAPLAAMLMTWGVMKADGYKSDISRALLRVAAIFLLSPLLLPLLIMAITPKDESVDMAKSRIEVSDDGTATLKLACNSPAALKRLATLPEGFILSQIDLGAPLLIATPHSVSSAPYHRNEAGNALALDVYSANLEEARTLASQANADYFVFCKDFPETTLMKQLGGETSLITTLLRDETPDWLQKGDFGPDYPLAVYKVLKD